MSAGWVIPAFVDMGVRALGSRRVLNKGKNKGGDAQTDGEGHPSQGGQHEYSRRGPGGLDVSIRAGRMSWSGVPTSGEVPARPKMLGQGILLILKLKMTRRARISGRWNPYFIVADGRAHPISPMVLTSQNSEQRVGAVEKPTGRWRA